MNLSARQVRDIRPNLAKNGRLSSRYSRRQSERKSAVCSGVKTGQWGEVNLGSLRRGNHTPPKVDNRKRSPSPVGSDS